jgi:PBP1b-binding outer membrane lipoprotein LpoB
MRAVLIATGALLLAGCAGQPTGKQAAPAATTAATSQAPATKRAATTTSNGSETKYIASASAAPEAKTLDEAMKMGYKVVNEKGQTMYCREDRATGSHLKKERTCLTAQELEAAREANQRDFDNMKKYNQPPQGK